MCNCSSSCGCNITALTKGEKGDAGNTNVLSVKVSLTSAQILALFTTPIQIVPAPGVGLALQVITLAGRINYNTIDYATNTTLTVTNTGAGIYQGLIPGVLGSGVSKIGVGGIQYATTGTTQIIANAALNLSVATGNPTLGNSTIDVYLTYQIIVL